MKAGERFLLTEGGYSDYGILASLEALVDFDFDVTTDNYCRAKEAEAEDLYSGRYIGDMTRFVQHLLTTGLAKEVPLMELRIGCYGSLDKGVEAEYRKRNQ